MTDKSAQTVIAQALFDYGGGGGGADHELVDLFEGVCRDQTRAILIALQAGGFAVVPKEPTEAMRIAASACDWQAWDGETPRYIVRYRAMLAASNPKEEGSDT